MKQSTGDSGFILPTSCRSRVSNACAAAARSLSALLSQPLCRCRGLQPLSAFQGVSLERRVWTDPAGASQTLQLPLIFVQLTFHCGMKKMTFSRVTFTLLKVKVSVPMSPLC